MQPSRFYLLAALVSCAVFHAVPASAFIISTVDPDPWLTTASGSRSGNGAPATITWSLVPNGTTVIRDTDSSATAPSNLITFMNTNFGGNAAQTDPTLQPWFHIFTDAFGRWSQLGGVNFVYEPHDDGVFHPSSDGVLGVRGDIRVGGANIDGANSVLAFTYLPAGGSDMLIDTGDSTFFKNSTSNYINFRNTLMHEIGHAFGMEHVTSSSNLLMEPIIDTSFDGPQLDDVRGVHFFFGDANEKSNGGAGNNTPALSTSLGTIGSGSTKTIGASANVATQAISATTTDFVSISNLSDTDFYSFSVLNPSKLGAVLTPRGGVFTQGSADDGETPTTFDANARNNLAISIFASNGTTLLATASLGAAGVAETIANLLLPAAGTYFARITGADDTVQLYQLALTPTQVLLGDYNNNGVVDAADYSVWRNSQGQNVTLGTGADGNFDGQITAADFSVWRSNFGKTLSSGSGTGSLFADSNVPEPGTFCLAALGIALVFATSAPRGCR